MIEVPRDHDGFAARWRDARARAELQEVYASGRCSFVPALLPDEAVRLSTEELLRLLAARLGGALDAALDPANTAPALDARALPAPLCSPHASLPDGRWLRRANVVGVNVRAVGSFWNVVKYALTLPAAQSAIHLLPIWEPGVAQSLYGMASWQLNEEFFSEELRRARPELSTVERQLRAVVNLLHAMGKAVGMDVIPHVDRYGEMVCANPSFFEWLRRDDLRIVDHSAGLFRTAQAEVLAWLAALGPASPGDARWPSEPERFFSDEVGEAARLRLLFGPPEDRAGRTQRRIALIMHLYAQGLETVPATMAPPYRGLEVDSRDEARVVDEHGMVWRDYAITQPQPMSRVFGPLTRYQLYERLDDNRDWAIDFSRPRTEVWRYVCGAYAEVQRRYGFDFMRGDMSHVQQRPEGVPDRIDPLYDLLRAVKGHVRAAGVPHFGYFAESFLAPPGVMSYGDEVDHLEASRADVTLGDLQSTAVGSPEFLQRLRRYLDLLATREVAPCFTIGTADKDDPRFDRFFADGNALRLFMALFIGDMPSYTSIGYEVRDRHDRPAPNEHYTKLYVFHFDHGPKATRGPFHWGRNGALFGAVTHLRLLAEHIWQPIEGLPTRWLLPPDPTAGDPVLAWTQAVQRPRWLFVANTAVTAAAISTTVPRIQSVDEAVPLRCHFPAGPSTQPLRFNGRGYRIERLAPGECRVYEIPR